MWSYTVQELVSMYIAPAGDRHCWNSVQQSMDAVEKVTAHSATGKPPMRLWHTYQTGLLQIKLARPVQLQKLLRPVPNMGQVHGRFALDVSRSSRHHRLDANLLQKRGALQLLFVVGRRLGICPTLFQHSRPNVGKISTFIEEGMFGSMHASNSAPPLQTRICRMSFDRSLRDTCAQQS